MAAGRCYAGWVKRNGSEGFWKQYEQDAHWEGIQLTEVSIHSYNLRFAFIGIFAMLVSEE